MTDKAFLDSPQKRISAIILVIAATIVVADFTIYLGQYLHRGYNVQKYAGYYLDCITGLDARDGCRDRAVYLRIAILIAGLAAIGLFWGQTYGRVIAAFARVGAWIRSGS